MQRYKLVSLTNLPNFEEGRDNFGFKPSPEQLILTWRHEDEEILTGPGRVYNIMNLI